MTESAEARTPLPGWDIRVTSHRDLLGALRAFLNDRGYVHRRTAAYSAGFRSELQGERDSPKRDAAYMVVGILLLPTVLLTSLGMTFIRQSRYSFRTVVRIRVEGETGFAAEVDLDMVDTGVADASGAVRVSLHMEAGAARDEGGIWRHTDDRREVAKLADERRRLEQGLSGLLRSIDVL